MARESKIPRVEIYDEVAYIYDGTLEGLLSAVFAAYANKENPTDVTTENMLQLRLSQRACRIPVNLEHADRVRKGIIKKCGRYTFRQIAKASLSSHTDAGSAVYRFIRYAMDEHTGRSKAISNISNDSVRPMFEIARGVDNECEKIRQFARFEHLTDENGDIWFSKVNPRDSVVPLILGHFVERFNVQPFIIFDENHDIAGVWDGQSQYLVKAKSSQLLPNLPSTCAEEAQMQDAWRRFYKAISVESRYNPELRRQLMPMRFWKNITELKPEIPSIQAVR